MKNNTINKFAFLISLLTLNAISVPVMCSEHTLETMLSSEWYIKKCTSCSSSPSCPTIKQDLLLLSTLQNAIKDKTLSLVEDKLVNAGLLMLLAPLDHSIEYDATGKVTGDILEFGEPLARVCKQTDIIKKWRSSKKNLFDEVFSKKNLSAQSKLVLLYGVKKICCGDSKSVSPNGKK